jgi:hypothetical protein
MELLEKKITTTHRVQEHELLKRLEHFLRRCRGGSRRVRRRCGSYDSIGQCSYYLRHQCQQRVWDQRRPRAAERSLLEKPTGQGRVGGVEIGRLFQRRLFYESGNYRCGGIGTAFGNSGTGIVDGPGQANLDLALSKTVIVNWPIEKSSFQFRAEFFNELNHPQSRLQLHLTDVRRHQQHGCQPSCYSTGAKACVLTIHPVPIEWHFGLPPVCP